MMTSLVFLSWFFLYLTGLAGGLGGEDSGEFAAAAATLGVSHPPGYPLYALLGRLACLLPAGSPAFRLNLMSAAAAAGAAAVLFTLVRREAVDRFALSARAALGAGLVASLAIGSSQAFWYQGTISDKYALNMLFFSLLAFRLVRGEDPGGGSPAGGGPAGGSPAGTALLLGLGFSHHLQTLYLVPGFAWAAFAGWGAGQAPRWRAAALLTVLFLAGFSTKLLYPPIRAARSPVLLLGRAATAGDMAGYLRADNYSARVGGPGFGDRLADAAGTLARQAGHPGMLVLGGVGLALWVLRAGPAVWLVAGTGFVLASVMNITGREFYLLPVAWLFAAGTGFTIAVLLSYRSPPGAMSFARVFLLILVVAGAGYCAFANRGWGSRGSLYIEYDYGRTRLESLPTRAVAFMAGDDVIYPFLYMRMVEGRRPDVTLIAEGYLTYRPERERLAASDPALGRALAGPVWARTEEEWSREVAAAALREGRPVFQNSPLRRGIYEGMEAEPRDALWEVSAGRRRPARPSHALWLRTRGWHHDPSSLTERQRLLIRLSGYQQRMYADLLEKGGLVADSLPRYQRAGWSPYMDDREGLDNNRAVAFEKAGRPEEALAIYLRLAGGRTNRPEVYLNAGNILVRLGRDGEAVGMYREGLARSVPGSAPARYAERKLKAIGKPNGIGKQKGTGKQEAAGSGLL